MQLDSYRFGPHYLRMDIFKLLNLEAPAPKQSREDILNLFSRAALVSNETERVCQLPFSDPYIDEEYIESLWRPGGKEAIKRDLGWEGIKPKQAEAVTAAKYGGCVGLLPVGGGKTWTAWQCVRAMNLENGLILVPKQSDIKGFEREVEVYERYFYGPRPGTYRLATYGKLSSKKSTGILEEWGPDGIVMDECDALRRAESARTRRFRRYMDAHPEVRLAIMSGSIWGEELEEVAYLFGYALRNGSPLPRSGEHLKAWAGCVDLRGTPTEEGLALLQQLGASVGVDVPYEEPDEIGGLSEETSEAIRAAIFTRVNSTRGIVSTTQASVGCGLDLIAEEPEVPKDVQDAIGFVMDNDETPDQEEVLVELADRARVLKELSCGFYYRWAWEKTPLGRRDDEWMLRRKVWNRCVREELKSNAQQGYDSALLVFNQIAREYEGGARQYRHLAYQGWNEVKDRYIFDGKRHPPKATVWINKWLFDWVDKWVAQQTEPVIVWYSAEACEEELAARGYTVFGAGSDIDALARSGAVKTVAASIDVCGRGKNLQAWRRGLILEPPSNGRISEQLLGRMHRPGQRADTVYYHFLQHTEVNRTAVENAREKCKRVFGLTRSPQKLLDGRYEGPWSIYR